MGGAEVGHVVVLRGFLVGEGLVVVLVAPMVEAEVSEQEAREECDWNADGETDDEAEVRGAGGVMRDGGCGCGGNGGNEVDG